jgi:hypothetical protein
MGLGVFFWGFSVLRTQPALLKLYARDAASGRVKLQPLLLSARWAKRQWLRSWLHRHSERLQTGDPSTLADATRAQVKLRHGKVIFGSGSLILDVCRVKRHAANNEHKESE